MTKADLAFRWAVLKADARRKADDIVMRLVFRLPARLIFWAGILLAVHAGQQQPDADIPGIRLMDALEVWERKNRT